MLESAVTQVRQAEVVKLHQLLLKAGYGGGKFETPVCVLKRGSDTPHQNRKGTQNRRGHRQAVNSTEDGWCGKFPSHDRNHCPARDSKCRKCSERGHFQALCRSAKVGSIQGNLDGSESPNNAILGGIQIEKSLKKDPNPWNVTLCMEGRPVNLHIHTGTDVTVITKQTWKAIGQPALSPVGQTLRGPEFHSLSAKERFTSTLKFRKQALKEVIYVVKGLTKPLLKCPAIEQQCIAAVTKELTQMEEFPSLFQGLGKIEGKYTGP